MGDEFKGEDRRKFTQEQFQRVYYTLEEISKRMQEDLAELKEDVKNLRAAMFGNGTLGWNTRIDRLEQKEKNRSKLEYFVFTTLIGTAILTVWNLITKSS